MRFLTNRWLVQSIGIAGVALLIWYVGPLVAIAGQEPLSSELARALAIAALVTGWVIYRLLMRLRAARKDQQLMKELSGPVPGKTVDEAASEEEIDLLRRTFEDALRILKDTRGKGGRGNQFLYELPWYLMIGAPGSGKTTALVHSGLQFPLAERFGKSPVKGISGTRNCDWWFTDEAILIDTAGRYTTQDSHQIVDAAAWKGFLGLIKKHRPERPLNGVLVTMSVSDLLQQTEEERQLNAKAIRRRVAELSETLGVRLPVYLLFTKCDLVAGFNDFFATFNQDERAQVWGETFPAEDQRNRQDFVEDFGGAFDALINRLDQRTFGRLYDERDVQRRGAILEFPQQFALLKPSMMAFLRDAFGLTRFEAPALLRGIYFTSGTQEGTPIDRVMGVLASAFHLDRASAPVYSGRGKSYFLTRLLRDVVFREAELAGIDARAERRQRLGQFALYASAGVLASALVAFWTLSYLRNGDALRSVSAQIDRMRAVSVAGNDWLADVRALLPSLQALREARQVFETAGWSMHLGLYQGHKIESALDRVYRDVLQRKLLPIIRLRLEQRIAGAEGANPDLLYELLRVYLLLGEPERLKASDARDAARHLIAVDWQRYFTADPDSLAELSVHLDNLLELPPAPVSLNDTLIAGARARLTQVPRLVQVYTHLKNEELLDHSNDLRLSEVLGKAASGVFVVRGGGDISDLTIPGFFTAEGYAKQFLTSALKALEESSQQNWVLGNEIRLAPGELEHMRRNFERLYFADYGAVWRGLLEKVQLRRGQTINQTAELLDELAQRDSPLKVLLETIEKNTTLSRVSASIAGRLMEQTGIKADAGKLDAHAQKALELAKATAGVGEAAQSPIRELEQGFEPINRLVRRAGDQAAPVDELLGTLKDLHGFALMIASGSGTRALQAIQPGGAGGTPDQAVRKLKDLPEPLQGSLSAIAASVIRQTGVGAKAQLKALLESGISAPCRSAIAGRYPFARGSRNEVSLTDFGKLFSPNGTFDTFFKSNLQEFVDTSRTEWRPLPAADGSVALSRSTIAQFQQAARIRDAFFPGGGAIPKLQFELRPLSLDERVALFSLNVEGQEVRNQHGPEQVALLQWPGATGGSGVRMIFRTLSGQDVTLSKAGPWAWFRLLEESSLQSAGAADRFQVTFQDGPYRAVYELRAGSVNNPFNLGVVRTFRCPEGL